MGSLPTLALLEVPGVLTPWRAVLGAARIPVAAQVCYALMDLCTLGAGSPEFP